ncbi:MAG: nucleotidyl transferase AbiEii/AbiGii toxin family protein [bacterium]
MTCPKLDSIKDKIKKIAQDNGKSFNEMWQRLVLERFLAKIARSDHHHKFIFKGGMLLSMYITLSRETVDLDFLLTKIKPEGEALKDVFKDFESNNEDDFSFSFLKIEELAKNHIDYGGFRAFFNAIFGNTKTPFTVDVGFGDAVRPIQKEIKKIETEKGFIYDDKITLLVYPLETIFAEKLETVVSRAEQNSRMKDFFDLLRIIESNKLNDVKAREAVRKTFNRRKTKFELPINVDPNDEFLVKQWQIFKKRVLINSDVNLQSILETINQYLVKIINNPDFEKV